MKSKIIIKLLIALTLFCISSNVIYAQPLISTDSNNVKIEWLRNNVIQIKSVDPDDENYSDLDLITSKIGKSRVVLLGEQSHGDGTTFLVKTRLIKFLVKKMGFDVLLFESGLYDCEKINEFLKNGDTAISAIRKGIFSIWNQSEQFQPLVKFIDENRTSLQIGGIDCQFTGTASKEFFISDLEKFLKSQNILVSNYSNWPQVKIALKNISEQIFMKPKPQPPTIDQQKDCFKTLESIIETLQGLPSDSKTNFWKQILKSSMQQAKSIWLEYGISDFNEIPVEILNIRDFQMGDNLIWQALTNYPNKKIIVWVASSHAARNHQKIEAIGNKNWYKGYISMGEIAYNKLGDEIYIIGFTAYEGSGGLAHKQYTWTIEKPLPNSLEELLFKTNYENCFLDFRKITPSGKWLEQNIISRPFGYANMISNLTQNMDGIIFTRKMIPSTSISK